MKVHWESLLLGAVIGVAGLYLWQTRGKLGVFVDRSNPYQPIILNGGGHSIGG